MLRRLVEIDRSSAGECRPTDVAWVLERAPALEPWIPLLAIAFGAEVAMTPEVEQIDPANRSSKLREVVVDLLTAATDGPVVFVVDDAHRLDEASDELFAAIARRIANRPWLLIALRWRDHTTFVDVLDDLVRIDVGPLDRRGRSRRRGSDGTRSTIRCRRRRRSHRSRRDEPAVPARTRSERNRTWSDDSRLDRVTGHGTNRHAHECRSPTSTRSIRARVGRRHAPARGGDRRSRTTRAGSVGTTVWFPLRRRRRCLSLPTGPLPRGCVRGVVVQATARAPCRVRPGVRTPSR